MNFIIWSYEDGPVGVEKTNAFLKTYTHRCETYREAVGRGNLYFKVKGALSSDYGFHPFSPKESLNNKISLAQFSKIF
jgi:hypothetical protein